jgi:hypothetical protein
MMTLGGFEIAGGIAIAVAIGALSLTIALGIAGDWAGRQIDAFFGVGGHWANERRVQDDAADDPDGFHGVTGSPETMPCDSGNAQKFASPRTGGSHG